MQHHWNNSFSSCVTCQWTNHIFYQWALQKVSNLRRFSGVRGICFLVKNGLKDSELMRSSNDIPFSSPLSGDSDITDFATCGTLQNGKFWESKIITTLFLSVMVQNKSHSPNHVENLEYPNFSVIYYLSSQWPQYPTNTKWR